MFDDLYYRGKNGKIYGGTAALLHFISSTAKEEERKRQAELEECMALARKLGYISTED